MGWGRRRERDPISGVPRGNGGDGALYMDRGGRRGHVWIGRGLWGRDVVAVEAGALSEGGQPAGANEFKHEFDARM